jgi:hypothetical protein
MMYGDPGVPVPLANSTPYSIAGFSSDSPVAAELSEDPEGLAFAGLSSAIDGVPGEQSSPEHFETMPLSPERLIGELESKRTRESPARAAIIMIYIPYTRIRLSSISTSIA